MANPKFDSLYIPIKAGQHAHAIWRARTLLSFDWLESAVTCKVWRASRRARTLLLFHWLELR